LFKALSVFRIITSKNHTALPNTNTIILALFEEIINHGLFTAFPHP